MQYRNIGTRLSRWLPVLSVLWCSVWASEITITRLGSCDWTCNDEQGRQLSCHTRVDKAIQACANRALADGNTYFVRPSAYRVTADIDDSTPPDPEPPLPDPEPQTGAATLIWTAPTHNEDGSVLTDLAGFKLYYGEDIGDYPNVVNVENPNVTTWTWDDIPYGTYYFTATAYNESGIESRYSNVARKTIGDE